MKEKLLEMLKMQHEYNQLVFKEHGSDKYTFENLEHALFDELGELNHELKATWCWWKHTQKPVDREKLLEEYVDCIHFGLCLLLKKYTNEKKLRHAVNQIAKLNTIRDELIDLMNLPLIFYYNDVASPIDKPYIRFHYLLCLGHKLGFTFDEIYEAYVKKNNINRERLKKGY